MKREFLLHPCLDIVGPRVPNCLVDRSAGDSGPEVVSIEALAADMGPRDAAVIYPEGRVVTSSARTRAMTKLGEREPDRSRMLAPLRHLLPPRSKGTIALLRGAPDADVVLMAHVGLEELGSLRGVGAQVPLRAPVEVSLRRIPRAELPPEPELAAWLDGRWLGLDEWAATRLAPSESDAAPAGVMEASTHGR